jgi:hypothetical protein
MKSTSLVDSGSPLEELFTPPVDVAFLDANILYAAVALVYSAIEISLRQFV